MSLKLNGWERTKVFLDGEWRSRYEKDGRSITEVDRANAISSQRTRTWLCRLGTFKTVCEAIHAIETQ